MTTASEIEKDFSALDCVHRARFNFALRICEASISDDEDNVLSYLRLDKMFEFAEFFFTLKAMGLRDNGDIAVLADLHNVRIDKLLRDPGALARRGLRKDRLLDAIFTSDVRPRLDMIWNEQPGAIDQSNLARLLVTQMSSETTRSLAVASEKAGLLSRRRHPTGATVVLSTGVMEDVLEACLRDMRLAIAAL
jgi:hypothetical protein